MTITKSYSEKSRFLAIYKASLKQQLPIGIVSLIVFFLMIPLPFLVDQMYEGPMQYVNEDKILNMTQFIRDYYSSGVYLDNAVAAVALSFLMLLALIVALMQTAYMQSKKMTDLYHAIPVKRSALLTANSLASLTVIFVPFLALVLVTMAAILILYGQFLGGYGWFFQYTALDLFGALIAIAGVYAFTVFIATRVGTVFDAFALTGVLGVTPLVVFSIIMALWASLTYGANNVPLEQIVAWLSPFSAPFLRIVYLGNMSSSFAIAHAQPSGVGMVLILFAVWLVIAAVLYAAAVVSYNRRKSELSEQTQPQGVLQMIAKCFAAFCGAGLFYVIFYEFDSAVVSVVACVFGALLIGLVAELILSRGVRSLRRNLAWLAGSGVLFCLVLFVVDMDFIGYEGRVPEIDTVESVTVDYRGRFRELSENYELYDRMNGQYDTGTSTLTSPESIATVVGMHHATIDNKPDGDQGGRDYGNWVSLNYKLKDGSTISRNYYEIYNEAYRMLSALETQEEFIRQNHSLFLLDDMYGEGMAAESVETVMVYDSFGQNGTPYNPTAEEAARIVEAARQDMLAETYEELASPAAPAFGYLEFNFRIEISGNYFEPSSTVVLGASYTNTMAALQELGMWTDVVPEVDEVRFYPANHLGLPNNEVFALSPNHTTDMTTWWSGDKQVEVPTLTDPAEVEAVLAAGRNQLMGYPPNVCIAAYYQGGEFLGGQLIRFEDLPAGIQSQAAEQFGWSDELGQWSNGFNIMPEAVSVVPAMATVPKPVVELSVR